MELDLADLEDMEALDDDMVPLKRMPHNSTASTFVVLMREDGSMACGAAAASLKFTVKEVDATTGEVEEDGYEDEYPLEDVEVRVACSSACHPPPRGFCLLPSGLGLRGSGLTCAGRWAGLCQGCVT